MTISGEFSSKPKQVASKTGITKTSSPVNAPSSLAFQRLNHPPRTAAEIQSLQRLIGNHATQQILRQSAEAPMRSAPAPLPSISPARPDAIQLMRVDPLPPMQSQWHGLFVDLNCGWYCEAAAIEWWAEKNNKTLPDIETMLPKLTKRGFSPSEDGSAFTTSFAPPDTLEGWESALEGLGPIMVAIKLAGGLIGHYVLFVGVDAEKETFEYLDPLSSGLKTISYKKIAKKFKGREGKMARLHEGKIKDFLKAMEVEET